MVCVRVDDHRTEVRQRGCGSRQAFIDSEVLVSSQVMDALVTYRRKIRYSDTDMQGIVFNGNYFTYFDDALTDLFEALGMTTGTMHREGFDVVTAHAEIDFISSARIGETVETGVMLERIGITSIIFVMEGAVGDRTVVRGNVVWVTVDSETFTKILVPEILRAALEAAAALAT